MLTQQQLAQVFGVSDRAIRLWVAAGMPRVGEGPAAVYDEGVCRAWCVRHGKTILPPGGPGLRVVHGGTATPPAPGPTASATPVSSPGATPATPPGPPRDRVARAAEVAALRNAGVSPIERARAVLVAASSALADAIDSEEGATGRDFDSFRASLDGLRQAEAAYLELEQKRETLIDREAARAAMGGLARRFVLGLERLEVRVAAQVELWLADEAFRKLSVEERSRAVRAWVAAQTKQGRVEETAELDRLIAAEVAAGRDR